MNQSYDSIRERLLSQRDFRASNLSARNGVAVNPQTGKEEPVYSVYSYNTCLLEYFWQSGDVYFNDTKYSVTTSRHQNRVHAAVQSIYGTMLHHTSEQNWLVPRATSSLAWKFQANAKSRISS